MDYDIYELIAYLAEQKETGTYDLEDESSLEEFIYDYYNIDSDKFTELITDLLPLCSINQSPLTGNWYRGFGTDNIWLIKKKIE